MPEIRDGEDPRQWYRLEIRLKVIRQSIIPQKQFIIIIKYKKATLSGDFIIDLMHYNEHKPTNKSLDSLASNSYFPYVI